MTRTKAPAADDETTTIEEGSAPAAPTLEINWGGPDWVRPEDREAYAAAAESKTLDAAGFGSREEYEGRSEMDRIAAEAAAAPQPGEQAYDWAAEYDGMDVYVHELPGGVFVGLPKFEFPNTTMLVELDDVPEMKQPRWLLMKALELSPEAARLVRSVKVPYGAKSDPIGDLIGKWIADATEGLTPGESQG